MRRRGPPLARDAPATARRSPPTRARLGHRRAARAVAPGHPGPGALRRARRSTRRSGTTTCDLTGKRVAVIGTGASRHPVRPEDRRGRSGGCTCSSARRRGSMPKPDIALPDGRGECSGTSPGAAARPAATRSTGCWRPRAVGLHRSTRSSWPAAEASPARTSHARCPTRTCAPSSRPDYTIGCKRILLSNDYYPALDQPNVELVTDGISRDQPRPAGRRRRRGRDDVDVIIYGTGFKVTDALGRAADRRPRRR